MMGTWGAGGVIKIIKMMFSVSTDLFLQMAPSLDTWGGGLTESMYYHIIVKETSQLAFLEAQIRGIGNQQL